jgi:colanic acid biosynthesis glycosyl transferase WcaI
MHLGINYWPEETGIAPFTTGRCEYFASCGHEVVACCGVPYYPEWRVPDGYRRTLFKREQRAGVTLLRSRMYVPRKITSVRRVLHEGSFVSASFLYALSGHRPDLLLVTSPPLGLAASAMALSRLWRVPYVFHVADLQPDTAVDLGMLRHGRFVRALYGLEEAAYHNAALVSTLTEGMRRRIVAKGVPPEKVVIFSDWVEPSLLNVPPPIPPRSNDSGDDFVVAHFGNIGFKQGLDVVIEAAKLCISERRLNYLLVGDGAARPALEARATTLGLSNLRFLPLQPHEHFLELLARADVCLVTQQRSVADIVFPSKVITLLASARPVIASVGADSEVARVVLESGAGIVVAPEDPRALVEAVVRIRSDPLLRVRMGRAGRVYALERWERGTVLKSTERSLVEVLKGRDTWHSAPAGVDLNTAERRDP